jgi:mercuric reductase
LTALELEQLPQSLLEIGGGYIGCELDQMLARATIIDIVPILSAGEPEISKALVGYLLDEGILVREGVKTRAIRKTTRSGARYFSRRSRRSTYPLRCRTRSGRLS